jgi:L-histidine Nalpha-methyltransferase
MPFPIHIDVLLTEADLAEQFLNDLQARRIPEKFFYWFPLSVRAWLALCQDGAYRNYIRSDHVVRTALPKVLQSLPHGAVELVSLASGQGSKDLLLLTALAESSRPTSYLPVDSSIMLLELACVQAAKRRMAHRGLKADLTQAEHLEAVRQGAQTPPRVLLLLGNTLGAFDPLAILTTVGSLMRAEDLLLVDGELGSDDQTRAGYDNPVNRAFAFAPLRSIGLGESDGKLVFEVMEDLRPGLHRLGKYFELTKSVNLTVAGVPLRLESGERIRMSHSGKYTREAFTRLLEEAGFSPLQEFLSDDQRFLMVLARRAS